MPSALFPFNFKSTRVPQKQTTLKDKVDSGELIVRRASANSICVEEPEGMGQSLVEVVRADLTGDGLRMILLFEYCYATHGTLGYGGITAITRNSEHGTFVTVNLREPNTGI